MTAQVDQDLATIDLTDPQTFLDNDLHAMWARFRAESPVHRHPATANGPEFWAISRYADVLDVYRDNKRFTSERGNVLSTLLQGYDSSAGKMIPITDGKRHQEIRNLMLKSFSARVLQSMTDKVHGRTRGFMEKALELGEFDFVGDLASHIPINSIGDLMDVPAADRPNLVEWNARTLARYSAEETAKEEVLARNEILMYFGQLVEERRANPGEDVISTLATATIDGEPLTEDEIVFNCYSLILGGEESSRASSIGGMIALSENPDQWRALKEGTIGVDTAVEEVLRWTTPAMHFGRSAVVDTEVGGQVIRAGDSVTLWNTSANLDETVFEEPHRFDLARTPNKHISFGYGPHFCIGAFLGRLHVTSMLEALRTMVGEITLTAPPQLLLSNMLRGYLSVPVALSKAS